MDWKAWGLNPSADKIIIFLKTSRSALGGIRGSLWEVKQLGHEVNHSASSRAKVKNEWSYTSTPYKCLHGMDRGKYTPFTFF
jgi:hypothetical protein